LWELEQRFLAAGLAPDAAYDDRATNEPFATHTAQWIANAARALAHCAVGGTAFMDLDAVVIDGSFSRTMLTQLLAQTTQALDDYNWEGLWRPQLLAGDIGSDARALGGALLPLHENFAPDRDLFLKAMA
jgi:hypothetical protein